MLIPLKQLLQRLEPCRYGLLHEEEPRSSKRGRSIALQALYPLNVCIAMLLLENGSVLTQQGSYKDIRRIGFNLQKKSNLKSDSLDRPSEISEACTSFRITRTMIDAFCSRLEFLICCKTPVNRTRLFASKEASTRITDFLLSETCLGHF